jgi:hypothetical protein
VSASQIEALPHQITAVYGEVRELHRLLGKKTLEAEILKQVALSKVDSWKRRDEFPKEFVTLPGESYPSSALVDACYTLLLAPKSAALK